MQLDRIDESLSACQVGITMASIGIGFLGEPSLARLIEPIFGGLSHGVAVAISVAIAFTLVTSIHIALGEQVPKILAITRAEAHGPRPGPAAGGVPHPERAVHGRLTKIANAVVRLFGVRPESSRSSTPPRT